MIGKIINKKIWIYTKAIDFRKQLNGLIGVVAEEMGEEAKSDGLYVFRNRQRDKMKILMWDRNGFVMGYKRLERGKFDFPDGEETVKMDIRELMMLVSGMPMVSKEKTRNGRCFSV